jgi:hypothetical protein
MCVDLILGIDLACRAAHQASLARPDGTFVWTGRKFFTRPAELEKLWADIGLGEHDTLRVVLEPTRTCGRRSRRGFVSAAPASRWCPPPSAKAGRAGNKRSRQPLQSTDPPTRA